MLSADRNGNTNSAYDFNNTYATMFSLPLNTAGDWSFAFWMKLVQYEEWKVLVDLNQNQHCQHAPQIWQRYNHVYLSNCLYGTNNTLLGRSDELVGNWYHFVIVNTADSVQIYRDGAVISAGSYSWPTTTSVDLTLANHRNDASVVYSLPSNVYFDEVGIWSRGAGLM